MACDYRGLTSRMEVSRQQFEEATQDLLDRTRFTTAQTLKAAGLDWADLDRVLMVGGSTRMPMVRQMLAAALRQGGRLLGGRRRGRGPRRRAARRAVPGPKRGHRRAVQDQERQLPQPGRGGHRPLTHRRRNGILIPRNTPLPVTAKRTFKTQKANQHSILVQIVEGESPSADDCNPVGKCTVRGLPHGMPARSPVDVCFQYETNGRLKVRVSVANTDREVETEIIRENSLPKEHLDGWRRYIARTGANGLQIGRGGSVHRPPTLLFAGFPARPFQIMIRQRGRRLEGDQGAPS